MDQQFSLSWNNFHGNLSKGFAGLLGKGEFVDVTLAVEGHLLQAHKVILSICSPYFKKMFQLNPCQHPIVVLRDVSHKAMKDLLQFMYHGEVSVKREDLTSFIGTAELLQVKGLTNKENDEEYAEKNQELSKFATDTHNASIDNESCMSGDNVEATPSEEGTQNSELDLSKQRDFIERLSTLKRKSEEYLQKNYYATEIFSVDKRPRLREKTVYNKPMQSNNYDHFRNLFDNNPVDASINYSKKTDSAQSNIHNDECDKSIQDMQEIHEPKIEIKPECDDSEIIVTDPAVCTTPKNYDSSRDGQKEAAEYQSSQDNALALVVNGSSENQQLPVRYKYIYSRKGHKQLVHMNFVYTKHSTSHGKTSWRCVQYFSLNRCPATVETIDAMIYAVNHQHNHENCFDKLTKNNVYEMGFENK